MDFKTCRWCYLQIYKGNIQDHAICKKKSKLTRRRASNSLRIKQQMSPEIGCVSKNSLIPANGKFI